MVATTIMAPSRDSLLAIHTTIVTIVFLTSLLLKPYRNAIANKVIILFCLCNLLGIIAQWFEAGSEGEALLQTLYLVALMITLVIFVNAGLKIMSQMARSMHTHMLTKGKWSEELEEQEEHEEHEEQNISMLRHYYLINPLQTISGF